MMTFAQIEFAVLFAGALLLLAPFDLNAGWRKRK